MVILLSNSRTWIWRIGGVVSTTLLSEEGDQVGSEDKMLSLVEKQLSRRLYFVKIVLKVQD